MVAHPMCNKAHQPPASRTVKGSKVKVTRPINAEIKVCQIFRMGRPILGTLTEYVPASAMTSKVKGQGRDVTVVGP